MDVPTNICKVCRRTVAPAEGTVLHFRGRYLGVVHREPCSHVVASGVQTLSRMVLTGARAALAVRAPKALATFEAVKGALQRLAPSQGGQ